MALIRNATDLTAFRQRSRRVLAVFPHPDDESYGPAGTLFRIGQDPDAATAVFLMTRGEASSMGGEKGLTPDEVAALRRDRLRQVDVALGLDALLIGDLPDSGMAQVPMARLTQTVSDCIEALDPQVIIAHDPRGVNAHPDHIAAHWAIRAALANRPDVRLAMLAYLAEMVEQVKPRLMFATPDAAVDCEIVLSEAEVAIKERCLEVHEAIVTLVGDGADGRIVRPGIERYDFLGENLDPPVDDLFAPART